MFVKILKGTNQIGGCVSEISTKSAKIIIDFGEDLPNKDKKIKRENPMIAGLTTGTAKYDAVFITHSHGDHIGLIDYILKDIPVYVEEKSFEIHKMYSDFVNRKLDVDVRTFTFEDIINIKDIKVKPYIVDHSSYNSCMFLISSNNKKILHTGDYRNHGYKGSLFEPTLNKIGKIDLLITEGTSISRSNKKYKKESKLSSDASKIFTKYNQVFILQSSTNVDRITTFYKASKNKNFIMDILSSNITSYLSYSLPNPLTFDNVYVWNPIAYRKKSRVFKEKYINPFNKYMKSSAVHNDFTMLVKTSMYDDIKMLHDKGLITNACLVHSMWENYLTEEDSFKNFKDKVTNLGIDFMILHTSGHADKKAMKLLEKITNPNKTITIHTNDKEKAKEVFINNIQIDDNEVVEV